MTGTESTRWVLIVVFVLAVAGSVFFFSQKQKPQISIQIGNPTPETMQSELLQKR